MLTKVFFNAIYSCDGKTKSIYLKIKPFITSNKHFLADFLFIYKFYINKY